MTGSPVLGLPITTIFVFENDESDAEVDQQPRDVDKRGEKSAAEGNFPAGLAV